MSPCHRFGLCAGIVLTMIPIGCRTSGGETFTAVVAQPNPPAGPASNQRHSPIDKPVTTLQSVTYQEIETDAVPSPLPSPLPADSDELFAGISELPLETLVATVTARNPSLQAAYAAWNAAAERYPQAVALDDPMLQTMFAPATFSANSPTQSSYVLGVAQRVPWHGKRALKGQVAQWDANASAWDASEVRLRLEVAARIAFFDYYLVRQELDLNRKNLEVTQDFRSTAKARYEANQVSEQDLSLADLELAKLEQERVDLSRGEKIAIARINTLLHRRPDHTLPAPPGRLEITEALRDADSLRETALQQRPELAALAAKIQSEQAAVALACKEYYPDFEFMGRYDAFWTDSVQRPMVGMNMNIPLNQGRRGAAVREAQFKVTKLINEHAQQQDMVREEVQVAHARVEASRQAAALYTSRVLPAAEANLEAARAAYIAGSIDFSSLMTARREFIMQQIGHQRSLVEYHRSRADLERAVGSPLHDSGTTVESSLPLSE